MAKCFYVPSRIIPLSGKRCIVIPSGGSAELLSRPDGTSEVLRMSEHCKITEDGYEIPDPGPIWPGAVRERIHPFPPSITLDS